MKDEECEAGAAGKWPAGVTLELLTTSDAGPVPACPAAAAADGDETNTVWTGALTTWVTMPVPALVLAVKFLSPL